jgi:hypothetical protein
MSSSRRSNSEQDWVAPTIAITIHPTERPDYFSVTLDSEIIVKSSRQPRCDAARVLHRLGYPDDALLVSHKESPKAKYSMRGPLGDWRKLRVREDRNGPRFAKYEPFTSARVSKKKAKRSSLPDQGTATHGDEPSPPRGAKYSREVVLRAVTSSPGGRPRGRPPEGRAVEIDLMAGASLQHRRSDFGARQ